MSQSKKQNIIDINKLLLSQLNKREQDIVSRRFGLSNKDKQTLEEIGRDHNLTRERIRQLEAAALKKIKDLEILNDSIVETKGVINELLEEYGGLIELDYLLNHLTISRPEVSVDKSIHKNNYYFIISKLLGDQISEVDNSKLLKKYIKSKDGNVGHFEEIAKELLSNITEKNSVLTTEELFAEIKNLNSHKKHELKLAPLNKIDLRNEIMELAAKDHKIADENKAIYSLLMAATDIEQNKLGYWGINNWSEIKPRTINEKIYLVLKENKRPMHFTQIAEEINKIAFDRKNANAATVHNELILGDRYVLVGRGMYTLTEWGYKKGTVTEIIIEILKGSKEPVLRDEIVEKVLEQRLVKKTTVILALTNNNQFVRNGMYYTLV